MWKQKSFNLSATTPSQQTLEIPQSGWPWQAPYLAALASLAGCAGNPVNLEHNGALVVEKVSSSSGHVWWAEVQANRRGTWVTGEIIRHTQSPTDRPGHVDIEVVLPQGMTTTHAAVALDPVYTAGGESRRLAFTAYLLQQPPSGSTVRVIHHREDINHETP